MSRRAGEAAAGEGTKKNSAPQSGQLDHRELGVVFEGSRPMPRRLGLGHPELDALELTLKTPGVLLGVGHAVASRHEIELPVPHDLLGAQAVAVEHLSRNEPGHGLEAQVRVGTDVDAALLSDGDRTHVVGEAPGTDGAPGPSGQHPADGHVSHRGTATRLEQDLALGRPGHLGCLGHVVGADRSAHATFLYLGTSRAHDFEVPHRVQPNPHAPREVPT